MRSSAGNSARGLGPLRWLAHRRAVAGAGSPGLAVTPSSAHVVAALEAVLAAEDVDKREFALRLSSRLQPLVQRGVPPRVIEAAPVPRAARLRFADGTTVLVQVAVPGELGTLALTMRQGSLKPAGWTADADGSVHLQLCTPFEHGCMSLHVVGLDQPD